MASTEDEREAWRNKAITRINRLYTKINDPGVIFGSVEFLELKNRIDMGWIEINAADHDESFQKVTGEWMKEPEDNQ